MKNLLIAFLLILYSSAFAQDMKGMKMSESKTAIPRRMYRIERTTQQFQLSAAVKLSVMICM